MAVSPIDDGYDGLLRSSDGIMPHIDFRDRKEPLKRILPRRYILLNKDNLELLRGYKAIVEVDSLYGELIITLTDLKKTCREIFDKLTPLKEDEKHETNLSS